MPKKKTDASQCPLEILHNIGAPALARASGHWSSQASKKSWAMLMCNLSNFPYSIISDDINDDLESQNHISKQSYIIYINILIIYYGI